MDEAANIKLFELLGIDIKGTYTQQKVLCPQCSAERKNKNDRCLSVNLETGVYCCHNCGWKGIVKREYKPLKEYLLPVYKENFLSEKTLKYFDSRRISKDTINVARITEQMEFIPKHEKEMNCICFNYFRGGKLVNVKYRDATKAFKMVKDAELIFYNIDSIKESEYCGICEGEMDCLSYMESDIFTVVSVPNGASKGANNLKYLDNCIDYFTNKKKIILSTDNDAAGIALREELARRLGKDRCWMVEYPQGCKDANDVLVMFGREKLKDIYNNPVPYPITGILNFDDAESMLDEFFTNGYEQPVGIGYTDFDKHLRFALREMTLITGCTGHGKSSWMDNVAVRLAAMHGWKFGVYSGETLPTQLHMANLISIFSGYKFFGHDADKLPLAYYQICKEFIKEHFFFFDLKESEFNVDSVIEAGKQLVMKYGIRGFIVDNWSTLEYKIPVGMSETKYVGEVMNKFRVFRNFYNVHFFLLAHPTKMGKDKSGKTEVPTLYSVSGSANFANLTDNGICVYRTFDPPINEVSILKVRHRFNGMVGHVPFEYDTPTGRMAEQGMPFEKQIHEVYQITNDGEIIKRDKTVPF